MDNAFKLITLMLFLLIVILVPVGAYKLYNRLTREPIPEQHASTEASSTTEEFWTDQQKAKDPSGFMKHITDRGTQLLEKINGLLESAHDDLDDLNKKHRQDKGYWEENKRKLANFCQLYERAQRSNTWPVKIGNFDYGEQALKRLIEQTAGYVKEWERIDLDLQEEHASKVNQIEKLTIARSQVELKQKSLNDQTSQYIREQILKELNLLDDDVYAVSKSDTEQEILDVLQNNNSTITPEEFDELIALYAPKEKVAPLETQPADNAPPQQSHRNTSKNTAGPVNSPASQAAVSQQQLPAQTPIGGKATVGNTTPQSSSPRLPRQTLTPEQKAAMRKNAS